VFSPQHGQDVSAVIRSNFLGDNYSPLFDRYKLEVLETLDSVRTIFVLFGGGAMIAPPTCSGRDALFLLVAPGIRTSWPNRRPLVEYARVSPAVQLLGGAS
jgi:hypothetical protein